jgi:hypothetical protein
MHGGPDPLYIAARRALLDALQAVEAHLGAVVLVGAQAVYVHTGEGDLAVAPYTTDADLALDPDELGPEPLLEDLLTRAGFARAPSEVGAWTKNIRVEGVDRPMVIDLLVPESLAGQGRRGARIPPHHHHTARRVAGLEGALIDLDRHPIRALDPDDLRQFHVKVAGPAALLVAKLIKVGERAETEGRRRDKDALDILRLLRATSTDELAERLRTLVADPRSARVAGMALDFLTDLFRLEGSPGCRMAARAAQPLEPAAVIAASAAALSHDLLEAMGRLA